MGLRAHLEDLNGQPQQTKRLARGSLDGARLRVLPRDAGLSIGRGEARPAEMVPRLEPGHLHLRARRIQLEALCGALLDLREGWRAPVYGVSFVKFYHVGRNFNLVI